MVVTLQYVWSIVCGCTLLSIKYAWLWHHAICPLNGIWFKTARMRDYTNSLVPRQVATEKPKGSQGTKGPVVCIVQRAWFYSVVSYHTSGRINISCRTCPFLFTHAYSRVDKALWVVFVQDVVMFLIPNKLPKEGAIRPWTAVTSTHEPLSKYPFVYESALLRWMFVRSI